MNGCIPLQKITHQPSVATGPARCCFRDSRRGSITWNAVVGSFFGGSMGQPTRKDKVPATKSWGNQKLPTLTYYDILWPYHIINKSDKSGGSSKQMQQKRPCLREANQTLSGQTDLDAFGSSTTAQGRGKNIPPEIKNKANYIISKFWIKFQCADPLQQKRRITIAPLRFQVIKIQIIQPLHVVLHLAVGWVGPWQKSSPIVHSWPRYPRRPWLTPSGPSCWLPQPQNGWPVSTCPNIFWIWFQNMSRPGQVGFGNMIHYPLVN